MQDCSNAIILEDIEVNIDRVKTMANFEVFKMEEAKGPYPTLWRSIGHLITMRY